MFDFTDPPVLAVAPEGGQLGVVSGLLHRSTADGGEQCKQNESDDDELLHNNSSNYEVFDGRNCPDRPATETPATGTRK